MCGAIDDLEGVMACNSRGGEPELIVAMAPNEAMGYQANPDTLFAPGRPKRHLH